jgi:pimeloyl-ACP methyl ester carboxylesterase
MVSECNHRLPGRIADCTEHVPPVIGRQHRENAPPAAPSWFTAALAQKPEHLAIEIDGCRIHMRAWGLREHPPLVLVHGGGAHSGWWDHIAPFFAHNHRVIAPDLSGHGDSGTRTTYDLPIWGREVLESASAAGPSGRPTIVGHSMGGFVTASAAQRCGQQIDSIVVIDSPLRDQVPEAPRLRNRKQRTSGYRSKDEILARFTPVPSQETVLPYVAHHVADESVRRTLKGWIWKFDRTTFDATWLDAPTAEPETMERTMAELPCRVGYIRCGAGVVPPDMATRIRSILQLRGPFIELAEAGHHPMLDQPLPLVATLRTLLEMWSIT